MGPAMGCAHPLTRRAVRIASCVVLAGVALGHQPMLPNPDARNQQDEKGGDKHPIVDRR